MLKKGSLRKFFTDVHLWLGIGSGIILFVVCLTGTILAFESEISRTGEKNISQVSQTEAAVLSPDSLITLVQKQLNGKVTAFRMLEDGTEAYQFYVKTKEAGRPPMYYVNQYTGAVLGKAGGGPFSGFVESTEQLHRFLLLDPDTGRPIVGVATILFVLIVITGLIIWTPKRWKLLKQNLSIKTTAGWKRINHDLHSTLGFYSLPLLLILGLTGLNWSFEWYRNGVSSVIGDKVFKQRNEKPMTSDSSMAGINNFRYADFIAKADKVYPYSGDRYIMLGKGKEAVQVRKKKAGFFALSAPDKIQFDRYTGDVLKVERFADLPFGHQLNAVMRSLHVGDVMGMFSKIVYFIACLIATSLPVTGTIIWLNKLKKKRRRNNVKKAGADSVAIA